MLGCPSLLFFVETTCRCVWHVCCNYGACKLFPLLIAMSWTYMSENWCLNPNVFWCICVLHESACISHFWPTAVCLNRLIIRGKPKPSSVCCMKKREHWVFLSFHVLLQIVWVRIRAPNKSGRQLETHRELWQWWPLAKLHMMVDVSHASFARWLICLPVWLPMRKMGVIPTPPPIFKGHVVIWVL